MAKIPIDDGIPPPRAYEVKEIYPIKDLKVGQSFLVPEGKAGSVRAMAHRIGKRMGRVFAVRPINGQYRCWRLK